MPRGPLGGPRPGATCNLALDIRVNKPDREIDSEKLLEDILSQEHIFNRAKDITLTEGSEITEGGSFEFINVQILLRENDVLLLSVNSIVDSVEKAVGRTTISTSIETV